MSGEKAWFWYFVLGIIYIAILFVLVRPGSDAESAVVSLSKGLSSLVTTAVGGTAPAGNITTIPTGGTGGTLT
jgi:hypothetical protein